MSTMSVGAAHESHGVAGANLAQHHRFLADYLSGWADALSSEATGRNQPCDEADFALGYQRALRDLAGHLYAGDALPHGPIGERQARQYNYAG